jgi:hypothetical protein
MASDNDNYQPPRRRRIWLVPLRVLIVVAIFFTAVGASGIFAMQLCSDCPPQRPDLPPQLPDELEKDTKFAK